VVLAIGVAVPFLALLAAVPIAWGWGLSWLDLTIGLVAYLVTGFGVAVGLHRHFTHGAFKAARWLRVTLAVAGSLSMEGAIIQWVADHRRHHAYADREGDPHSPWRYGATVRHRPRQGTALRPLRLAVPATVHQPGPLRPRTCSPTTTSAGWTDSSQRSPRSLCSPRRCSAGF